jgi:hypothetical protein
MQNVPTIFNAEGAIGADAIAVDLGGRSTGSIFSHAGNEADDGPKQGDAR